MSQAGGASSRHKEAAFQGSYNSPRSSRAASCSSGKHVALKSLRLHLLGRCHDVERCHRLALNGSTPFGWVDVLADVPPVSHELIYANTERGFALCSMRNHTRSRYYLKVPSTDTAEQWSLERFCTEQGERLDPKARANLATGPALEMCIAPLRSFVAEPMRFRHLLLAGDAAHIVRPTGAKGLNMAASDVGYLWNPLADYYQDKSTAGIDSYCDRCLRRVWRVERFSWWFTSLMHRFPDIGEFGQKMQEAELDYLVNSHAASTSLAENYVGLPLDFAVKRH